LIGFEYNQSYEFIVMIFVNHFGFEVFRQWTVGFSRLRKKKPNKLSVSGFEFDF